MQVLNRRARLILCSDLGQGRIRERGLKGKGMSATGLALPCQPPGHGNKAASEGEANGDYEAPPRRRVRQRWPRPINAVVRPLSSTAERRDMSSEIESGRQNRNKSKGGDEGEERREAAKETLSLSDWKHMCARPSTVRVRVQ